MGQNTFNLPGRAGAARERRSLSLAAWHARFVQQVGWTRELRRDLFGRAGLAGARRVLEVGCGTGALTQELSATVSARVFGLDRSAAHLAFAQALDPATRLACGAGEALPYAADAFDVVYCHFFLLWVLDPLAALTEMRRVTRPGGMVLALAEPDYGGRIDYPTALAPLGDWQRQALERQGADVYMGRQLGALFAHAGLQAVETGVLGGRWGAPPAPDAWEGEWAVLQSDLQSVVSPAVLQQLHDQDAAAWQRGERILFVPTFYACGRA
jgi:SAM-dependent methyltransferase